MIRTFAAVVLSIAVAGAALLAQRGMPSIPEKDVEELAILARAAAPAFAADALLRLVSPRTELGTASTEAAARKRVALLDDAWALADYAHDPLKPALLLMAPSRLEAAEYTAMMQIASYGFDRLSLKSRVVSALLRDRREEARNRFLTLSVDLPRRTCRDSMAFDLASYYNAATAILRRGFTNVEQARGDHLVFAENLIHAMRSPAQVASVVGVLSAIERTEDLARLTGVFAIVLGGLSGDNHAFMWSTTADLALERLFARMKERRIPPDPIIHAYRGYLVRHLTQARCETASVRRDQGFVQRFNAMLRKAGSSDVPPITGDEMTPAAIERVTPSSPSLLASRASRLNADIQAVSAARRITLVSSTKLGEAPRTEYVKVNGQTYGSLDEVPIDEAFYRKVVALKDELATWRMAPDDHPVEYFELTIGMYTRLFSAFPIGPLSEEILSGAIETLMRYDLDRHGFALWHAKVGALLSTARSAGPETRERVRQRLLATGHPSLKAIFAFAKAFGETGY